MNDIAKIKLNESSTIKEALRIIDSGAVKIAVVVNEEDILLGTLTDGDIRRAILEGKTIEDTVAEIYSKDPTVVSANASKEEVINICTSKKIHQIPVVDEQFRIVGIDLLDELLKPQTRNNQVVLMVGGLGTRLRPLTEKTPKPMLHVGGKPILQTIVEKFVNYGFVNIVMCVGYKSKIIQDFFEDGSKFGATIEYVLEDKRMGTAGALSLLKNRPCEPFFVMNGDLLTNVNFEHLLEFHESNDAVASMCVREYDFQVPYGVVRVEEGNILAIEEKPVHKFFVSAGIYMLDPHCIDFIPKDAFYDMPTLFEELIAQGKKSVSFPLREYWLDIGRIEEYEKANQEYHEVF